MLKKVLLPFESAQTLSIGTTGQKLINMYSEKNPQGSRYEFALYNCPGLTKWVDLGVNAPIKMLHQMNGSIYVICNLQVYRIDANKVITSLGFIPDSTQYSVADNAVGGIDNPQICVILDSGQGYIISPTSVTQITAPGFPLASTVTFIDSYFVVSKQNGSQFFVSNSYDGFTWNALNYATAEEKPDNLIAVYGFNSILWLFCSSSIEMWQNVGSTNIGGFSTNFPFQKIPGTPDTTRGLAAKGSISAEQNQLFWLGNDKIVYTSQGFSPLRISTHAIEQEIESYGIISDAEAFCYYVNGHKFYTINFPSQGTTLSYDILMNTWHHRESYLQTRWRANFYARLNDVTPLVGDYQTGLIYQIDQQAYDENGNFMIKTIYTPPLWNEGNRFVVSQIRLDLDSGIGNLQLPSTNPKAQMQFSDDGGRTYSNERDVAIGTVGLSLTRVIWRRCGITRERIWKFSCSDSIPFRITGLYADIQPCLD